jgi:hypothetical protein|tara:strand:- start:485 stop:1096 length:612 start_codon:yes stop_codon:yes gene_type:complete
MYDVAEGFDAYKTYLALKRHFTSDYDYFKYNGKVRAGVESFLKRNDKFFFRKLAKKYDDKELVDFFVSNFIVSDNWIGNLISQESEDNYVRFKKRRESLSYHFDNELHWLVDYCRSRDLELNKLLLVEDNNHPLLLKLLLQKKISIETIIIMDSVLKFLKHWDNNLDDIVWEEKKRLIVKYNKFLTYDPFVYRKKLKEIINES